jgi:hypothetical protein
MMRIMLAAYALCAALILSLGVFGSTPAEAGYYGHRHNHGGYHRGYRARTVYRGGYYGGRGYHGGRGYYSNRGYYGGGYRTAHYSRPVYGPDYRQDAGYYNPGYYNTYADDGYYGGYDGGYGYGGGYGGGYGYGCNTVYIPYGWRWYRASSC